jgi:hypothetical protein
MPECSDQQMQNFGAANPANQTTNSGAVTVNLEQAASSIFNPNYALSALQNFVTFNNVANEMFGIEARWFRAVPQQRSKDVMFKEYTLSCVEDTPLCLKVIVPDGNVPDSKYTYDLMGLEYEVPLEIQLDKKYWEKIAGFGTAPQKKDIVYIPMSNKLYQVESSYLKRGFMEQETTWICNLKKYSPEASRKEGSALQETIDMYTVSEQDLFGNAQNTEYNNLTDKRQMSPFNSTSKDAYKILDEKLKILTNNVEFYGTIFAQGFYDLTTSKLYNAIEYINPVGDDIKETYDRSLTSWFSPQQINTEYDVVWVQQDVTLTQPANYKIKIKALTTKFKINDTFVIYRPGAINFYAKVISDTYSANGIYWIQIDDVALDYLNSINAIWTSLKGYKMKVKTPINLLDGVNSTDSVFNVSIYANQYIKVTYGSQEYVAILSDQLNDNNWYGIVVNIGNSWGQYNVYVWEQHPSDSTAKIRIKFYETMKFVPEYVVVDKYFIEKSPAYVTNIRLFKTTIEEEKQSKELLSYFTKDSDQCLILDNSDPRFSAPYISQQR